MEITVDQSVGVIGAGRLGTTFALALQTRGVPVAAVASRSDAAAEALAERLGSEALAPAEVARRCDLLFLAVPDDALSSLAASLPVADGQMVVHMSGALGLEVFAPVRGAGGLAGCLHPLQSFPERFGPAARFDGIYCGVEGDGDLGDGLAGLCAALGTRVLRLEGVDRARYHLAAVFASNYVVALHAAAARAFELAGLPASAARAALAPLTRGTAESVAHLPLEQALTGPLARGDLQTVRGHREALSGAPELLVLYDGLARALLGLALPLDPAVRAELERLIGA